MIRLKSFVMVIFFWSILVNVSTAQDSSSDSGAAPPDDALPASYNAYVVQSGDSLSSIAEAFDTSVADLRQLNGLEERESITAGQTLILPTGTTSYVEVEVYEVQPGDTLFGISKRFNTRVGVIQGLNDIGDSSHIEAGQSLLVPSADEANLLVHVVAENESLASIAQRYLTTVSVLKALNGIADEDELITGARILAPITDQTKYETYEVKAADSLYSLSRRFATTEETLISLNGLSSDRDLEVGQVLLVPRIDEDIYEVYVVEPGDSLYNIARRYHTTVAQLRSLNGVEGGRDLTVGRSVIVPRVDETIFETVVVETGDSLYSLSRRHGVSVSVLRILNRLAEARDLKVGEVILVPKLEDAALGVHVIRLGDSLTKIAEAYETSIEFLQSLNGIANPSLIQLDDTILVPVAIEAIVRPDFYFGIQVFTDEDNISAITEQVSDLGVDWVKIDVSWAALEAEPGIYDYRALDAMVAALELIDVKIMLNLYDAPDWSRRTYTEKLNSAMRESDGPPQNLDDFSNFVANLATRYAGLVDAYEIWKSPNLLKFWTVPVYHREPELTDDGDYGIPDEIQLGPKYYVPLLKVAYDTIKAHDAHALVISGGLALVGFSDGYNAVDTGTFLQGMLDEGAASSSDAIGLVFSASAVPPTLECCDKPPGVDSHYESFLQNFTAVLEYYSEVLRVNDHSEVPIFATQVGWGTHEGNNIAVPSSGYEWLNYTSEDEQALYVSQAFNIVQKLENVTAMVLYNFNGCAVGDAEACFFSLIDAAGERRPVYDSFRDVPKSRSA